jgi:predicted dehydrogenase
MAQDYARVLQDQGHLFEVIGRSKESAERFAEASGLPVAQGGVLHALANSAAPDQAIVAVGVDQLAATAIALVQAGTRRILLEKPGGLNTAEIAAVDAAARERNATVLVAYNRRFYASVAKARDMIAEDGGATSCSFEFTEWSHVIAPLVKPPGVKEAWFLANSTHVADLAFHLCGFPQEWKAWRSGALDWHPSAARFCGSGTTQHGVLFSYHADWEAPGRWGVEVLTRKRRLIFRPMEQLQVVPLGSVKIEVVALNDGQDKAFKPGLHEQVGAFMAQDDALFCTIGEQLQHCTVYDDMAGYGRDQSI